MENLVNNKNSSKCLGFIVCAFFIVYSLYFFSHSISSNDFGLHIKTGEFISFYKVVPHIDFFSFTAAGKSYVDHEWLSQLIMYWVYKSFNIVGLQFIHLLVIGCVFFLLFSLIKVTSLSWRIFLLFPLIPLALMHDDIRPNMFSYIFTVLLIFLIQKRKYWYVPMLILVWANMHASFVLAVLYALFFIVLDFLKTRNKIQLLIIAAIILTPLINPYGYKLYYLFLQLHGNIHGIDEWKFLHPSRLFFLVYVYYLGFVFYLMYVSKRYSVLDICLFFVFGILGFTATRFTFIASILLWPLLLKNLYEIKKQKYLFTLPIVLIILMFSFFYPLQSYKQGLRPTINKDVMPVYATNFLNSNSFYGRIFNDYNFGGYLIWKNKNKVFIDGRIEPFIGNVFDDYLLIEQTRKGWQNKLREYKIDIVMIRPERPLAKALVSDTSWAMVYFDYNSIIYIHNATNKNIKRIKHVSPWGRRKHADLNTSIKEMEYIIKLNPCYFGAFKFLSDLYGEQGDILNKEKYLHTYNTLMKKRNQLFLFN